MNCTLCGENEARHYLNNLNQYCDDCNQWYLNTVMEQEEEKENAARSLENYLSALELVEATLVRNNVQYKFNLASTNSCYWDCTKDDKTFKVRLSDHSQVYDADINLALSPDNLDGVNYKEFPELLNNILS